MARKKASQTEKPVPFLLKPLRLDVRAGITALGQLFANTTTNNLGEVPGNIAESANAIGLKPTPAEIGWRLIFAALLEAVKDMLAEKHDLNTQHTDYKKLGQGIGPVLEDFPVVLDENFFHNPSKITLLEKFSPVFQAWLQELGLNTTEAHLLAERLPSYFAMALHNEWGSHPDTYDTLLKPINTPFLAHQEEQRQWVRYRQHLQKQAKQPVFSESFGLHQIFVPPRGFYNEKPAKPSKPAPQKEHEEHHKHVIQMQDHLLAWLKNRNKDDAIRLVSGGPGSGKSSLCKILAAQLAQNNTHVVFVPLHFFSVQSDLGEALQKFAEQDSYVPNQVLNAQHLVLIFDGLDELAMQGKSAARAANDFLSHLDRFVNKKTKNIAASKPLFLGGKW